MEKIFRLQNGRRVVVCDEGNNINIILFSNQRNIQWSVLRRDYGSELCTCMSGDDICLAYLNTANDLIWDVVGGENRIILLSDIGNVKNIRNIKLEKMNDRALLIYQTDNPASNRQELIYSFPESERKSRLLVSGEQIIEDYILYYNGEHYILRCKYRNEPALKTFVLKAGASGELTAEEQIMCKAEYIDELKGKCKIKQEEFDRVSAGLREEFEENLKKRAEDMEKRYRAQYDELVKLTKDIQEEGKKWRQLYYKSVKS
ncbi:MAG: hypothetical protein NC225_11785 [Clostridium sp.]|nr:hypothetical protein [Clostridium sp.]MCM1400147.1 hypothetical protein [Clostridium sp.]MCM1460834.1 hypothetical protein [Bacteroides sp.]